MTLSDALRSELIKAQKLEITKYHVYKRIAHLLPDESNRQVILEIAGDEKRHYEIWQEYTGKSVSPDPFQIWLYLTISRLFGFTFGVKLMEWREVKAQVNYERIVKDIPEARDVIRDESDHEDQLMVMLDEESLIYAGSIVLGLNDALVELTGALAGLTFAFRDVNLIALSGLITGISASLSMASSEYLSTSSEETEKKPLKAAVYTGIAYILTVALLILPFLLLNNELIAMAVSLSTAVVIIALFNFFVSVTETQPFGRRFIKMAGISLGVAAISFLIGLVVRSWFGLEV